MVIDPYSDPAVKRRMQDLQQRKYRQGFRNGFDGRGNGTYNLTDEDKFSCLDPRTQQMVQSDKQRIGKLEQYAQPFAFAVGIGNIPPDYIVTITHPTYGHARRSANQSLVDRMRDPEKWFLQQIDAMKAELGYTTNPVKLVQDSDDPNTRIHAFVKSKEQLKKQQQEKGYAVTDKRKRKPKPVLCPDHGNPLVRGPEPDTLVCTVVECTRVARKKTVEAKVQEQLNRQTEPAAEQNPQTIEDIAQLERAFSDTVNFPPVGISSFSDAIAEMLSKSKISVTPEQLAQVVQKAGGVYRHNSAPLRYLEKDGRRYLVQPTPSGEAHLDVTHSVKEANYAVVQPGMRQMVELRATVQAPSSKSAKFVLLAIEVE